MTGILSYGVYLPVWHIQRELIATSEGIFSAGGERSVVVICLFGYPDLFAGFADSSSLT